MNGYIFFYNGKRIELRAPSFSEAQTAAVRHFKPPKSKSHMVFGALAEKDGNQVVHTADF